MKYFVSVQRQRKCLRENDDDDNEEEEERDKDDSLDMRHS